MTKMTPAQAFRALARYCDELAAALEGEGGPSVPQAEATRPNGAKPASAPRSAPTLDLAAAKALDAAPTIEGLTKTECKILIALAQAGRRLNASQIGIRTGLSATSGSFTQALANLRSVEYIEGPGSGMAITSAGLEALGPYPRLPEGTQLFDYWCHKVGGSGAKVLHALRQRHREAPTLTVSSAQLGELTGLSHTSGSFTQALADLRKLDLIVGGGTGMQLSDEMREAAEIVFHVHDRQAGKSVKVDRGGKVVR